ncbi:hypothetical protein NAEGRDRAFT_70974 [Naegleria gruberi]|uniref:Uncharacterized protein n=1 Tax=Naegleria gruberi TaxID=5762 RepID=D2VPT1_NAEGR|nr:uncharacterized protein NAEGRDRAFT_70974 [Naegleria gruberi]EFC41259.1 hypothetical protein NAEGRDRAFT_70974 [Naegleria gruberi]|eukprot:XP_002674003.1 hypothetical protein NAEGRDRAFT_70974 [Naegleria gruberi strain NEG-M]
MSSTQLVVKEEESVNLSSNLLEPTVVSNSLESNLNRSMMEEVLMAHSYEENNVVDLLNKNQPVEIDEETKSILNSKLPPLPSVIRRKTSNVARPLPRVPTTPSEQSEISRKTSFTKSPPTLPQKKHSSPVKEQKIEMKEDKLESLTILAIPPPPSNASSSVPPMMNSDSIPPPPPTLSVGSVPPPPRQA